MFYTSIFDFFDKIKAKNWARKYLGQFGFDDWFYNVLALTIDVILLVIIVLIIDWLSRKVLLNAVRWWVNRSKNKWDDYFYKKRVFKGLAHILPALIVLNLLPILFSDVKWVIPKFEVGIKIYIIVMIAIVISKLLKATENLMNTDIKTANSSLRTVSQVIRILTVFATVIVIFSILSGIKVTTVLGIFAGTSAILILIFQDTITGLLANLQITMYDLLRVGDWVTLDKHGVDGDVISIDLTTIKVRNFDKTISSVPAKAFVNDSFVNWRGMREEGARRIKRNILIDISSIKYCSHADIESFAGVQLIKEYITQKQEEIDAHNKTFIVDTSLRINGRRQTNIGIYRAYILSYLKASSRINQDFTIMVRQLQPTEKGVPIEVYCFASTIVWEEYEKVQADIFDHLYAATEFFGLRLYQSPSGSDMRAFLREE